MIEEDLQRAGISFEDPGSDCLSLDLIDHKITHDMLEIWVKKRGLYGSEDSPEIYTLRFFGVSSLIYSLQNRERAIGATPWLEIDEEQWWARTKRLYDVFDVAPNKCTITSCDNVDTWTLQIYYTHGEVI
jgi:hypothetical protein